MYELSNKPTAIPAFLNAKCMFSNAINELYLSQFAADSETHTPQWPKYNALN